MFRVYCDTLSDEQLEQLVVDVFPILHGILHGKVESSRKNNFATGKTRRDLMSNVGLEKFTEEQHSFVLSLLVSSFKSEQKEIDENFLYVVYVYFVCFNFS